MNINKFTKKENLILTEIYRCLNYFHKGNLNERLLFLEYPSKVKVLKEYNLIKPYNVEVEKQLNWYNLTEKGKKFFKKYTRKSKLNEDLNHKMYVGEYVKEFNKNLL